MRKISLISIAMLIVSIPTFAGGLLTNTNQHPAFLRMLSRGANTTGVDAALSNPAGLAFLPKDGFYTSLSIQSAFQTRNIDASCEALGLDKYYEGKASAPVIPSVFAAYKKVIGLSPVSSVSPVAVEKLRLTTVFPCSMPW